MISADTIDPDAPGATIRPPPHPSGGAALPHITLGDGADLEHRGVLGAGGMGIVTLAWQDSLAREVAVKQVRAGAPAAAETALFREARILGGLDHPNVLPVYALGLDGTGRTLLVMKRVEGASWASLLHGPARGDELVRHLEILVAICRAVHFAHARGVLHRDLKPDNVMIGAFGEVYLMDWGVAVRETDPGGWTTRGLAGTPCFLAPEMLEEGAALSPATDVFLLGACLHQILTGEPRHPGLDVATVLRAARVAAPVFYPGVPAELAAIASRACARDPAGRYPSAQELEEALRWYLRHRQSLAIEEAARGRLHALLELVALTRPTEAERTAAQARFGECRFGFQQALEICADNQRARAGLCEALAVMAPHEIRHGNLDVAAALLDDLEHMGEEAPLVRVALTAARDEQARLRAMAADRDLGVSARERTVGLGILAVSTGGVTLWVVGNGGVYPPSVATAWMAVISAGVGLSLWLARRRVLTNAINRALGVLSVAGCVGMLANRLLGWRWDLPTPAMLAGDLLVLTVTLTGVAAHTPRFWPAPAVAAVGVLATALAPAWSIPIFGASSLAAIVVSAWIGVRPGR